MAEATATELLEEMARVAAQMKVEVPDMRRASALLQELGPDAPCAKTGMTPLQWAIENGALMSFVLSRGASPTARGTGAYDRAPVDMLVEKGDLEGADTLVRHGADCPPEVAEWREREIQRRALYDKALKDIPRRLERCLKDEGFLETVARFEGIFGVKAAKVRGRKGHLTFKAVPLKKIAKAAGQEPELWFAERQAKALTAGVGLFTKMPPGANAKEEINIAPTTVKRELVCLSSLLREASGALPYERMEKADVLDALDDDHPFRLLASGPYGVVGILDAPPDDVPAFAARLLDLCPELHTDYQIRLDSEGIEAEPNTQEEMAEIIHLVARDIAEDRTFWLPWGVDH